MSFFKKLFGSKKEDNSIPKNLPWIEPSKNPYGIPLLDLRPICQEMMSFSQNPKIAENSISYGSETGTSFWGQLPTNQKTISVSLTFETEGLLEPGVLFKPETIEHKWAIFFDGENLIFVRSWLREVVAIAKTSQKNNELIIESIIGEFTENETPAFTKAILNYLLISHSIDKVVPAPLPKNLESATSDAGLWAFSTYGNMAHVGTFDENLIPVAEEKLRSDSLLHIAVAKADIAEMEKRFKNGSDLNSKAGDGLTPLQWSIAVDSIEPMKKLIELGANPNAVSTQGATPIMNAAQSNLMEHLNFLIQSGAAVNAKDHRGFTALHRGAEMGHIEIVKILLDHGADKSVEAENHTALSLATARQNKEIIGLLADSK